MCDARASPGGPRLLVPFTSTIRLLLALLLLASVSPVSAFRSLLPPLNSNTTGKSSSVVAAPPTLFLSGRDSASCACQRAPAAAASASSHSTRDGEFLLPSILTGGNDAETGALDGKTDAETAAFAPRAYCCADKEEALSRSFEAPNGVAFASIGDIGEANRDQAKCAQTLAALSLALDMKFVNLLGDNVYPHGVVSAYDPLWEEVFEVPFGAPSLEKVAFFPVLGNHDYHLDPYAQIDRCMRLEAAHARSAVPEAKTGDAKAPLEGASATQAILPWAQYVPQKFRFVFNQTARMRGIDGPRWRFPNFWYFTRHVFRNVPRHLSNPFVTGSSISDISLHSSGDDKTDVTVVTVYIDSMVFLLEEGSTSTSVPYKFPRDEVYFRQLDFLENTLKAASQEADWIFIAGHHPVVSDGLSRQGVSTFKTRLLELIAKYKVDTYLSGHEHLLAFFEDPEAKSTYIVSGSGSKRASKGSCSADKCLFAGHEHGFVAHVLGKEELHHAAVSAEGTILFTHTQRRQDRTVPNPKKAKQKGAVYPAIRRVYIGPYEISAVDDLQRLPSYVYFLLGMCAMGCLLVLVFCIRRCVVPFYTRSRRAPFTTCKKRCRSSSECSWFAGDRPRGDHAPPASRRSLPVPLRLVSQRSGEGQPLVYIHGAGLDGDKTQDPGGEGSGGEEKHDPWSSTRQPSDRETAVASQ
ncbi:putative serine/threonine protein phosphatase [Neospora caninum Liverpool]|uniref:Putative serine/threonine protein phosphatase n=1 Tax=Neospora caninum (strain Liverpool) TaxID=572307 RepID=F0V8Z0_NEOCL|nr:putative serine/threonine protein phosphatase [Neospora caninum Liverpool]CBZ50181.1 putative serine/threonine protein phosphatase [Neospora caninum Liverpool]CEL64781.1 TPA: serine/threonine protein phosphatase, putative [Neospora caninum Liverpool]|eukprot:XP_003880216.1 putative serine/threonine protein phosphatase [Neospora caninum Liverpool]